MRPALAALLLAGCTPTPNQNAPAPSASPSAASTTSSAKPEPPVAAPTKFGCAGDADCWSSCAHGAVNRRWWEEQYPGGEGCEDGCTSKGSEAPKCEQGSCVAYAFGKRAPECTHVEREVTQGPGPAHRCSVDGDCRMSCAYGAVNAAWYDSASGLSECKDGCAHQSNVARCQNGGCVAMAGTIVDPTCTRRSIHRRNP
jgi:hypothetical protein